jgi:pyruvate formate lyase activating enzyme
MKPVKESLLYRKLEGGRVRCGVCALRCVIPEGGRGSCRTRVNRGGTLYTLLYGRTSSVCVDPVEKKPLYHVYPGSRVLSMGARGCNFRCPGCQNWEISRDDLRDDGESMEILSPRESVGMALRQGSQGICWTYNEPVIWLEHALEAMIEARKAGLYTAYVTNGYATPEHLDLVGPHLTAWRVDLKGFSKETYKRISGLSRWEPVLEATRLAACTFGIHVECVTNVTPGINDDEKTAHQIAAWIRENVGPFTPWHVTRFHPHLELSALPPTPVRTLERFCAIAAEEGLRYVYIGNVPGHPREDTRCHGCGKPVIRREGYVVDVAGLKGGNCAACGTAIPGRFPAHP